MSVDRPPLIFYKDFMTVRELLQQEISTLPTGYQMEVIGFIERLKTK